VANQIPDTGLPVGTVLVFNTQIDQSLWSVVRTGIGSPDGLIQVLTQALAAWGLQVVKSDFGALTTAIFGGATPIAITVQMTGPQTYAQPDDIRSIIDGAITDALGGSYQTGSNVSSWTIPQSAGGSGQAVDTGAPAASTSAVGEVLIGAGIEPAAIADGAASALNKITSGLGAGTGIIVIVLGLAIVAAVFVAVAPTAAPRAYQAFHRGRGR
jgi:hypothetical protein